jgi:hypothetical protein
VGETREEVKRGEARRSEEKEGGARRSLAQQDRPGG